MDVGVLGVLEFNSIAAGIEAMDFMERLAPYSEPNMLVRDKLPLMAANHPVPEIVPEMSEPATEDAAAEATPEDSFDALKALRDSLRD